MVHVLTLPLNTVLPGQTERVFGSLEHVHVVLRLVLEVGVGDHLEDIQHLRLLCVFLVPHIVEDRQALTDTRYAFQPELFFNNRTKPGLFFKSSGLGFSPRDCSQ